MKIEYEGNPLKLQKILAALLKYKWVNFLILLLFIALGMLYFKLTAAVFESSATIEIKNMQNSRENIFGNAIAQSAGLETEIDILGSNLLIEKTLKSMGKNVTYAKRENFKTSTLYKERPFSVKNFIVYNPELYGKKILIKDLGDNRFSLEIEKSLFEKVKGLFQNETVDLLDSSKTYGFNELIVNDNIALQITKKEPFENQDYRFTIHSQEAVLEKTKKNLSIAPASFQSTILKLTYKDVFASRAKEFLNKLIDNYLEYSVKNQTEIDNTRLSFINKQLDNINKKLTQSENRLEGFKTNNFISDIRVQIEGVERKIGTIQEALEAAKIDERSVLVLYKKVQNGDYASISSLGQSYPVLATLVANLQNLELEEERLLSNFTHEHPNVRSVTKGIANIKSSIADISEGIVEQASAKRRALAKDLRTYTAILKDLPKKEKELGRHERVFEVNDHVYNYLLQKQSELSIEKVSQISNKQVLDYAHAASKPLSPKLPFIMAISTLLGLFMILLHTIIRTKMDVKIKTAEDISDISDIPLFGIVPYVKDKNLYNSVYVFAEPNSVASEAFRAMRTNLDYVVTSSKSKVILVSSSVPNEGKTVISANLAATIGMSEKKTVLVSLDLRRPELHHKFGLSNKIGMSDVLANRVSLSEAVWEHELYSNFNIITSGRIPPNPAELIASTRMEEVLEELRREYDYIIIDTPPINYISDAVTLFKHADINLFVVKSGFSEQEYVVKLEKLMKKLHIEHSGIILNSIKSKYETKAYFDQKYMYYEPM